MIAKEEVQQGVQGLVQEGMVLVLAEETRLPLLSVADRQRAMGVRRVYRCYPGAMAATTRVSRKVCVIWVISEAEVQEVAVISS